MKNLQRFNEMQETFNAKLQEAQQQKAELTKQFHEQQSRLKEAQYQVVMEGTSGAKQSATKAKVRMNELTAQVREIDEQLTLIEQVKNEQLQDILPSIIEEYKAQKQKVEHKHEKELQELQRLGFEYLLKANELGQAFQQVDNIGHDVEKYARKFGYKFKHYGTHKKNLYYGESERVTNEKGNVTIRSEFPIGITENEIKNAYLNGKLPAKVLYYKETGAVPRMDTEVNTYLNNKRKGGK